MLPRIITRTHYQVDEPAYLRVLIRDCSSPVQSEYPERIAKRLEDRLATLNKEFNLAAAKYCVDLSKGLSLLTENNFWTWSAHVLHLISRDTNERASLTLDLTFPEQLFFFRAFLEFDGAALLFFSRKLAKTNKILEAGENWNDVANEMMKYAYNSYLELATDIRDRAEIRQLLTKRTRQPYKGKSGSHQCFVHLNTMARIGLLQSTGREYSHPLDTSGSSQRMARLLQAVPDIATLEGIISKREWPRVAVSVFQPLHTGQENWTDAEVLERSQDLYKRVMSTGVSLCSLNTLIEAMQIQQLSGGAEPHSYEKIMEIFRRAQAKNPKSIRFHVDRIGRPAFITFF